MWQLLYRPDKLAEIAAETGRSKAVRGYVLAAGLPAWLYFALLFAGMPHQDRTDFASALFGIVVGASVNALEIGILLVPLWLLSLSRRYRTAVRARALLLSPLTIFVPFMIWSLMSGLLRVNTLITGWTGSGYALLGIGLLWMGIVCVAVWRIARREAPVDASGEKSKEVSRDVREDAVAIWPLLYHPGRLSDMAVRSSPAQAARGFIVGAGIPLCLVFAVGGAGVGEPYPTINAYFKIVLLGLVLFGPIGALSWLGVALVLLWNLALSRTHRTAVLTRALLLSPLVVWVPSISYMFLGSLRQMSDPDFGLGEPIPSWMKSPVVMWGGSDYVALWIGLVWIGIVCVAVRRIVRMHPPNDDLPTESAEFAK